jgi:phenylpyruvate tautomerase PptA (4-oxalocrotonate tautomerase family)
MGRLAVPMIDLTYVRSAFEADALQRLTDELVTILLRAERAPDTEFMRQNALVFLHPVEADHLSIGGRGAGEPRFRVELTVFAGALDKPRKEKLVADVHVAVTTAAGIDPEGSRAFHVWTLIHEVPEGNWGGGGKVVYYADVKGLRADDA